VGKLSGDLQRQLRKDKEQYLSSLCNQRESDDRRGRLRDLFKKVKEITGKFTRRIGVVRSKSGKSLHEAAEVKRRSREYTEDL